MKKLLIMLVAVSLLYSCDHQRPGTPPVEQPRTEVPPPQPEQFAEPEPLSMEDTAAVTHTAVMNTTAGTITLGLYGNDAPKTVENFIALARKNYYNGILFHRVVKGFVIQAGDPLTKDPSQRDRWGTGGEGHLSPMIEDELDPQTPSFRTGYTRGTLAMANRAQPNTGGSQFFIVTKDAPQLPKKYTIFGKVLDGMDVVDKIEDGEIDEQGVGGGAPKNPVAIRSVKIQELKAQDAAKTAKR